MRCGRETPAEEDPAVEVKLKDHVPPKSGAVESPGRKSGPGGPSKLNEQSQEEVTDSDVEVAPTRMLTTERGRSRPWEPGADLLDSDPYFLYSVGALARTETSATA